MHTRAIDNQVKGLHVTANVTAIVTACHSVLKGSFC